nr:zinc finger, SWIM-type [Tanacetum cinerariifolium]
MTTSSTSSLLPPNSPTTKLPLATTANLPSATSSTSHLIPSISTARACNINEADLFVVPVVGEENLLIEAKIEELDDVTMNEDVEASVNLELNQDGTMKRKIEAVLTESKHSLCMWHIMQKVPAKNSNIEVIPKRYILWRWRRDLIPPALRRNTNRYGEKDEAIENLTNEANLW